MRMKKIVLLSATFFLIAVSQLSGQEQKTIQLPPPQKEIGKPLMQVLKLRHSSRDFDLKALPLQELSNLLWAANGINRPETGKRTVPSAMNWQEVDIYVVMEEGTYLYDVQHHRLSLVAMNDLREATGRQAFTKEAPLNLVYVSDRAKMSGADDDDKTMWGAADVGFIAQNVYLYCASQGLAVVVRGMVDREELTSALRLRPEHKIILAQTIGYPK
jgi:SagB-type dehydrogenase family enzyme